MSDELRKALERGALLALRDLGVVRAPSLHEGFLGLARDGLARIELVAGRGEVRDFRLTERGMRRAANHV